MKKKLICLLALITIFTITGCGSKSNENDKENLHPNQTGYVEGQYFIENLTFSLPDGYSLDGENRYTYIDTSNALVVELYVDDNVEDLNTFIKKDPHYFYPTVEGLKETDINGNTWLKGKTIDNAVVYYYKEGNKVYSIMLSPIFTLAGMFDNLTNTVENSLYFKIN